MHLLNEGATLKLMCGFKGLDEPVGTVNTLVPLTALRTSSGGIGLQEGSVVLSITEFVKQVVQGLTRSN